MLLGCWETVLQSERHPLKAPQFTGLGLAVGPLVCRADDSAEHVFDGAGAILVSTIVDFFSAVPENSQVCMGPNYCNNASISRYSSMKVPEHEPRFSGYKVFRLLNISSPSV